MISKYIYLDNASTTPLSKNVLKKITSTYKNYWSNSSSTYKTGIKCATYLEKIRLKIANIFNAEPEDIIFTSGSSESISIVFSNLGDRYNTGRVVISSVEHQATIIATNKLKRKGWEIYQWPVNKKGIINISDVDEIINKYTNLVSLIWGQSEIGSLQPVQFIGAKCEELDILFHIDGTQILSNGIFNWQKLNCDLLSLSAHKFGGPKGIGLLLTNSKSRLLLKNSDISLSQEYSIRQGTSAIPLIAGMYESIKNIKGRIKFDSYKTVFELNKNDLLKKYFLNKISNIPNIKITGCYSNRLPNHISFILFNKQLKPIKAYKVINYMSDNNVAISSGSACSSSTGKPSLILKNMGYDSDQLYSNIRVSLGSMNKKSDMDRLFKLIQNCIKKF
tara:strand:+ start:756 stop:1928 length:1173 start_codon:yes stop_codon:yes gene_type:complete